MRRFIGLFVATIAVALPLSAAGASPASTPSEYRSECEQFYQSGKAVFDPLITNGKALAGPMEKAICGEQKHTPT